MSYQRINIDTASPQAPEASILLIYTGGTMGMGKDESGALVPFDFQRILDNVPSLKTFNLSLTVISFEEPIDSSNVSPDHWVEISKIIADNYDDQDGFVILHGTDTMAYTASALSFMLEGLNKPVVLTGAQLPISAARSDARENLITAIEIASRRENGSPVVPEVCIYFNYFLLRGNRSKKMESSHFDAFKSENYPALAVSGVEIDFDFAAIRKVSDDSKLQLNTQLDNNIIVLKLFPGISESSVTAVLNTPGVRGVVLETFGAGNAQTAEWLTAALQTAITKGIVIFNVSQCEGGKVRQGEYETSRHLKQIGVLSGSDITTEAAVTKMMILLGKNLPQEILTKNLTNPICGEMT